jgi:hypothetical protein
MTGHSSLTNAQERARVAFAAAHIVADPACDSVVANTPGQPAAVDWDATMAYRHHLWDLGFGVADAMDTAQRGTGLDWPAARELIERSGAEARSRDGAALACGVNTDQLDSSTDAPSSLDSVASAYLEQLEIVQDAGAQPIVMASRALAALATSRDDYYAVYERVLREASQPVILHWLGAMFDPQLSGYWTGTRGSDDLDAAADAVLELISAHSAAIDGIKVSLLDADREVQIRRRLPAGVRLYTGDDFNYPTLIRGDEYGHSDALLGVFDAIAPVAAQALRALDDGDADGFSAILDPTVRLARHLFAAPTYHYKTGIVFLAWLAGHQSHFTMVGGVQTARPPGHLLELAQLADELGLFPDPDLAARRLAAFREVTGHA